MAFHKPKIKSMMVRDKHTGRMRRKNASAVKAARSRKAHGHSRKGKHVSMAVKNKIKKGIRKELRSGRTKYGRRVIRHHH